MRLVTIVVGLLLTLGGCARPRVSAPGQAVDLTGMSWTVERIEELLANRALTTLRFEDGRVSGRAGCNQYSGSLQTGPGTVRVGEIRSTRMACAAPVMQQEARFLKALAAVRTARREAERVLLLDETGHVRLQLAPVPTAVGPPRRARIYDCPDGPGLAVSEADGEAIDAWLPDGRRRLPQVPSDSGARYSDGQVSVWNKGTEVLLERDGQAWRCQENQPQAPR